MVEKSKCVNLGCDILFGIKSILVLNCNVKT